MSARRGITRASALVLYARASALVLYTRAKPWFKRSVHIIISKHYPASFRHAVSRNPGFRTLIKMDSGPGSSPGQALRRNDDARLTAFEVYRQQIVDILKIRAYTPSGTLPGRRSSHEGETLVTRGRNPGHARAKPWSHEGEALVTRGRSPSLRGQF
jgi:hypothetical protein